MPGENCSCSKNSRNPVKTGRRTVLLDCFSFRCTNFRWTVSENFYLDILGKMFTLIVSGKILVRQSRENVNFDSLGKFFSFDSLGKMFTLTVLGKILVRQSRERCYFDSLGKHFTRTVSEKSWKNFYFEFCEKFYFEHWNKFFLSLAKIVTTKVLEKH